MIPYYEGRSKVNCIKSWVYFSIFTFFSMFWLKILVKDLSNFFCSIYYLLTALRKVTFEIYLIELWPRKTASRDEISKFYIQLTLIPHISSFVSFFLQLFFFFFVYFFVTVLIIHFLVTYFQCNSCSFLNSWQMSMKLNCNM